MNVAVTLPAICDSAENFRRINTGDAFVDLWSVICTGNLAGKKIVFTGIEGTLTDMLVRIELQNGNVQTALVKPGSTSIVVQKETSYNQVISTYFKLGVEHILLGTDHLLFVLGLLLITSGTLRIIKTVTAFTAAHSITLALATLGVVNIPDAPVEAVIALSIAFVAYESLRMQRNNIAAGKPWVVAFIFGLLHGLGFAGALSATGLPHNSIASALLFFNLGVEAGQLAFIAVVIGLLFALRRLIAALPAWMHRLPPYAIGSLAMFWVIQRVASF